MFDVLDWNLHICTMLFLKYGLYSKWARQKYMFLSFIERVIDKPKIEFDDSEKMLIFFSRHKWLFVLKGITSKRLLQRFVYDSVYLIH